MFIETEATPNPNTMKFLPGQTVLGEKTAFFPAVKTPRPRRWRLRFSYYRIFAQFFMARIL